jgi:periplasmic divalent cation tolerance protein
MKAMNAERPMAKEFVQVLTAVGSARVAHRIAGLLITERLAACVQVIGPITSTYRWNGKVETAKEWLCLAKTRRNLYSRVESAIRRNHPYEIPEILALPVSAGSRSYLAWLDREVRPGRSGR